MRYSIEKLNGFPSLVLDNGQNFGILIRWRPEEGGIAVTAGNASHTYHLTEKNCDLGGVRRSLAALITSP